MQPRKSFFPLFLFFLILSCIVILLSRIPFFSGMGLLSSPLFALQGEVFSITHLPSVWFSDKKYQVLVDENLALTNQLVQLNQLKTDNAALRDQFETSGIPASSLLPAQVIGDPSFIPGVTSAENLILDKGLQDAVGVGDSVVYKNNLIGSIEAVSFHASSVRLIGNKATSFTVKTSATSAQGVLTGQGNGLMVLGNVVLSDHLQKGDLVVTSGSKDVSGKGIPPGLVVGKIISVQKNPSSLYQSARVESLVHVEKLTTVFIMKGE